MAAALTSLPDEIILLVAEHLHNIEDYTSLSSTCRGLRSTLASVAPNTILRLAVAQSTTFFRPSPDFLAAATARELGNWARVSESNEAALATALKNGVDGMLHLALRHCGLTVARIRELHAMRFSVLNPVENVIDQCVGKQWYTLPDFWEGGVDDAYTIESNPSSTLFHLATYGELFAPDLDAYVSGDCSSKEEDEEEENKEPRHRALSVETRLEFIKYCVPDFACDQMGHMSPLDARSDGGTLDPRRATEPVGPYARDTEGYYAHRFGNNNVALVWVLRSSRWRPHWKRARQKAGSDFEDGFLDAWWFGDGDDGDWRQRLWENIMVCQGLDGLAMIRPELQDAWVGRIREWRDKIAALSRRPAIVKVGRQATYDYPFLLGDLRICASGYVGGT